MLALDHLPFTVRDAASIRADLRRLGFTTTAAGMCRWTLHGRNYAAPAVSVVFEHGYLDLIEVGDMARDQRIRSSPVYAKGIIPSGVVLSAPALEESCAALSARGIACEGPYEIIRELPGADPSAIHYRLASLRETDLPLAVIEDSAPAAMRTQAWLRHPNSATGVRCFHLRVPSLKTALPHLAAVFGGSSAAAEAVECDLGTAAMVVHEAPRDRYLEEVSTLLPRRDRATLLAVEFCVADLAALRAVLDENQVPLLPHGGGIAVDPRAGYGCGILFKGDTPRARTESAAVPMKTARKEEANQR